MMDQESLLTIITLAIALPIFWITVLFGMSRLGPWHALATKFPLVHDGDGARFWIYQLTVRAGNYGNCLYAVATEDHLTLKAILPFRPFHPPISIPYSEITDVVVYRRFWIFQSIAFRAAGHSLTIYSSLARSHIWDRKTESGCHGHGDYQSE